MRNKEEKSIIISFVDGDSGLYEGRLEYREETDMFLIISEKEVKHYIPREFVKVISYA